MFNLDCWLSDEEKDQRRISKEIDRQLKQAKKQFEVKLLLLGKFFFFFKWGRDSYILGFCYMIIFN
jgi:hypothetical protein